MIFRGAVTEQDHFRSLACILFVLCLLIHIVCYTFYRRYACIKRERKRLVRNKGLGFQPVVF